MKSPMQSGILRSTPARPVQGQTHPTRFRDDTRPEAITAPLIDSRTILGLQARLAAGDSVDALKTFNTALINLEPDTWQETLRPVINEFCFNLESFNPAFTAVLLQVQTSIGNSDYVRRDEALRRLIVPLAGEYGMHNGEQQSKTHRKLFDDWIQSMIGTSASDLIAQSAEPMHARCLMHDMMRDIMTGGGRDGCSLTHATYALGYNLAIEFLADMEKRWMLESFEELNAHIFEHQGIDMDWTFLQVHADDEKEHAALGHEAVMAFVPEVFSPVLERAMLDHDRDFAEFYNSMTAMLLR